MGYFVEPHEKAYCPGNRPVRHSYTAKERAAEQGIGHFGPKEIVGQKALAKGYHPMELRYFDQNGGQLKLKVTGSDGKEIPFTHLYAH